MVSPGTLLRLFDNRPLRQGDMQLSVVSERVTLFVSWLVYFIDLLMGSSEMTSTINSGPG